MSKVKDIILAINRAGERVRGFLGRDAMSLAVKWCVFASDSGRHSLGLVVG